MTSPISMTAAFKLRSIPLSVASVLHRCQGGLGRCIEMSFA